MKDSISALSGGTSSALPGAIGNGHAARGAARQPSGLGEAGQEMNIRGPAAGSRVDLGRPAAA
jgi:hypothetical protein